MEPWLIKELASPVIKGIFALIKDLKGQQLEQLQLHIESHLSEIVNWSSRVQIFGMSEASDTDKDTVELYLRLPKKFTNSREFSAERYLIESKSSLLLLGDPGSGKTTTLKRLVRKMVLEEPISDQDQYQFPILIRLREIDARNPLVLSLAEVLGIHVSVRIRQVDNDTGTKETITDYFVGETRLIDALPPLLNAARALLLLDGLDEVDQLHRERIEAEVGQLVGRLAESKLIVTCRCGEFIGAIDGLNVVELCSLREDQIREVSKRLLSRSEDFLQSLYKLPFADIASKPLYLSHLLTIYENNGALPEKATSIYKDIVELALAKWDKQRKIVRKSKYAGFDAYTKLEFLASLSYLLTYQVRSKVFDHSQLVDAYLQLYEKFNLPRGEAYLVAQELESHTGIITELNGHRYEFSHLSLQEYLCAEHIAREPLGTAILRYLREYPAPIAVAVALSSRPENLLGLMLLRPENFGGIPADSLKAFLYRLQLERPYFGVTVVLGLSFLKMLFHFEDDSELLELLARYLATKKIKQSIAMALEYYYVTKESLGESNYTLVKKCSYMSKIQLETPEGGKVAGSYIDLLIADFLVILFEVDEKQFTFQFRSDDKDHLLTSTVSSV